MKSDATGGAELRKECERLRAENARLVSLLEKHGNPWEPAHPTTILRETPARYPCEEQHLHMEPAEKVALFRRLFRGRTDVYPLRWESVKGRSGYSPACGNEWRPGICHKPRVKCGECDQRLLLPVTDQVIYDHLAGQHTVGVYPLLCRSSPASMGAAFLSMKPSCPIRTNGVFWRRSGPCLVLNWRAPSCGPQAADILSMWHLSRKRTSGNRGNGQRRCPAGYPARCRNR
jgi:hypothetical protein